MAISLHTNFASMVAQNNLNSTNKGLDTSMERLGTGYRINSAADDAAGLQIANRLGAQKSGMDVAVSNSQDAINMLQTADSAMSEVNNISVRLKELATQAANDTNTVADREALDGEYQELVKESTRIMTQTNFGGELLLEGGKLAGSMTFQIGAGAAETLVFDASLNLADVTTARDPTALGDLTSQANATLAIDATDTLIAAVGKTRSQVGANVNRLDHTINNLVSISRNTDVAVGRIMDADFAVESSNMTKQQMLMQSGISVLAKSNQMTGMVSSLLR